MVDTLSIPRQRQLFEAMEHAILDANAGADPNVAIAKQANEYGFGPEFACRMVEAFNTSKTIKHLRENSGEKRAETFPLADRDETLKLMYNPPTEKAAALRGDTIDRDFTEIPASRAWYPKELVELVKAACDEKGNRRPSMERRHGQPLPATVIKKARSVLEKVSRMRREIRSIARMEKENAMKAAHRLVEAFRYTDDPIQFHELEEKAAFRYGEKLTKAAMDIVWSLSDFARNGEKRMEKNSNRPLFFRGGRKERALQDYMEALQKSAQAVVDVYRFEKSAGLVEKHIQERLGKLGLPVAGLKKEAAPADPTIPEGEGVLPPPPPLPKSTDPEVSKVHKLYPSLEPKDVEKMVLQTRMRQLETKEQRRQSAQEAQEKVVGDIVSQTVLTGKPPFSPTWLPEIISEKPPEIPSLINPKHESEIRKIRLQLLANDMISNDPVLSAYAPDDVTGAINLLAETVPALSTNPLLMRSMVARVLQQGGRLDPAEIEQLLKTELEQRRIAIAGY